MQNRQLVYFVKNLHSYHTIEPCQQCTSSMHRIRMNEAFAVSKQHRLKCKPVLIQKRLRDGGMSSEKRPKLSHNVEEDRDEDCMETHSTCKDICTMHVILFIMFIGIFCCCQADLCTCTAHFLLKQLVYVDLIKCTNVFSSIYSKQGSTTMFFVLFRFEMDRFTDPPLFLYTFLFKKKQ